MDEAEAGRELSRIRRFPYGVSRTAAAESITRRIEADGPRSRLPEALLDLVEAYTFTEQTAPALVAFARALRLWDEAPDLFDTADTHNLFWEFKWIAGDLADVHQISRDQAEAFFADMRRRFAVAGLGSSSILLSQFKVAWKAGDENADELRRAWLATGSDSMDDCQACRIGIQVGFFLDSDRLDEAIRLGEQQDGRCNREPCSTLHSLALAYLNAGDGVAAGRTYRRALASVTAEHGVSCWSRGELFETLARGGELDRALAYLRNDDPGILLTARPELDRLRLLIHVVAGLSAHPDARDQPTFLAQDGATTVGELRDWAIAESRPIASALDARNGNTRLTDLLAAAEHARLAPSPLVLTEVSVTPAAPVADVADTVDANAETMRVPATDESAEAPNRPSIPSADELVALGRFVDAASAYVVRATEAEESGQLRDAGLAWAEAARCWQEEADEDRAHDAYRRGVALFTAGGGEATLTASILAAWAPTAYVAGDSDLLLDHLDTLLVQQAGDDDLGVRAELLDTKARLLASLPAAERREGRDLQAAAEISVEAAEAYAEDGSIPDAAEAFWVAGRAYRDAGLVDRAIWSFESALEGFTLAHLRDRRFMAADALITELRASGQDARADEIVERLAQD